MTDSAKPPRPTSEAGPENEAAPEQHDDDAPMTEQQLVEAKQYGRISLACGLADKALDLTFLGVVAFWLAQPLDRWLQGSVTSDTGRLALMVLLVMTAHAAISFPLSYFSGHVLEHRFSLSRQSFGAWLANYAKRNLMAVAFGLAMLTGLFSLIWLIGTWWWLAAAGAFFLVSIVLGQLAPVVILPLFYKIEKIEDDNISERMQRLTKGTTLSVQGVYRMGMSAESVKANAMLAGLGRTRRVLMADNLLDRFSPDEIEVIFAHEIGHHVFHHIPKMIVTGLLFSTAGFWLCDLTVMSWVQHIGGPADATLLPVYALPMLMFFLTAFSLILEPLQNIISRRYERQCDRYALKRTGLKQAYISAFRKLSKLNKDDPDPHPLEVFLFHSHPPVSERLSFAEE